MSIKLLATSDLHLGRRSADLPANTAEGKTTYTWHKIVDLVLWESVDALLLTGDIVDEDNKYFEAVGPLKAGFEKLREANVEVFLVAGNHDYDVLPEIIGQGRFPNVHLLGADGRWESHLLSRNGVDLTLVGWSFPRRHVREDPLLSFTVDISPKSCFTIGLLHGDADVADSVYAPLRLSGLRQQPVDAWVLGHIHKPTVYRGSLPLIFYPGSPHALSAAEPGVRGPVMLNLKHGQDIGHETIPLSPVYYDDLIVDVTNMHHKSDLRGRIMEAIETKSHSLQKINDSLLYMVFTLYLEGEHPDGFSVETWVNPAEDDYLDDIIPGKSIKIRKVLNRIRPAIENLEVLAKEPSLAGRLAETILAIQKGESTALLDEMLREWKMKTEQMQRSETYIALKSYERISEPDEKEGRLQLLQECRKLLSTLMHG